VIVSAMGFDAMTGALLRMDIRGREDVSLKDAWAEGPKTYLGLAVAGFPNLFTVTGPGSPSVLTNVLTACEQHVDWIMDAITHVRTTNAATLEATVQAQEDWVAHVNAEADKTLFPRAASWYMGANIPGKPRVFMPYVGEGYKLHCDAVAAEGYAAKRYSRQWKINLVERDNPTWEDLYSAAFWASGLAPTSQPSFSPLWREALHPPHGRGCGAPARQGGALAG
jgi:hypothetical protein